MEHIYLDHNATTPVDKEVLEAMLPYLTDKYGNASSVHQAGRDAKVGLENSRETIANIINCQPQELFFTSGGTESDNIAIMGTALRLKSRKNHLVVGAAEHHAIFEPAEFLHQSENLELTMLGVNGEGFHSAEELKKIVTEKTSIVSLMHANNETGAIQDIKSLASVAHEKKALFHTDAVQSIGKIKVDVKEIDVDMLSLTGHKIYGPKGAGALFIREGIKISPLFYGGSHEKKRRPGTENVAGIVGLAKALEIAETKRDDDFNRLNKLADFFIDKLVRLLPDVHMNSPRKNRIPQTVNVSFIGCEGESIVLSLDLKNISVSSGSACTSGAVEPSHVLTAMGIPAITAQSSIRFSMGRSTTKEQIEYLLNELPPIINRLREMSPVYSNK